MGQDTKIELTEERVREIVREEIWVTLKKESQRRIEIYKGCIPRTLPDFTAPEKTESQSSGSTPLGDP